MADKVNNLQDIFLNSVRKSKTPVTMFLVKGVKLQGIITWFDNFSVYCAGMASRSSYTSMRFQPSCPRIPSTWTLAKMAAASPCCCRRSS